MQQQEPHPRTARGSRGAEGSWDPGQRGNRGHRPALPPSGLEARQPGHWQKPPVTKRARLKEEESPRPRTPRSVQEKDPLGARGSRVGSAQIKAGAALLHNPMRPGQSPWPPSASATPRAQGARPVASGRSPRGQARAQPNGRSTYSDPLLMYPIQNSIPKSMPRPGPSSTPKQSHCPWLSTSSSLRCIGSLTSTTTRGLAQVHYNAADLSRAENKMPCGR